MKYQRVFNFIYFGFIDNELMNKKPTINMGKLNRTLSKLGDTYEKHEGLYKHAALMSADLLHRYLLENVRYYKETRPWVLPIDYMSLVKAEKDSHAELKLPQVERSTDVDCICFIHEAYIEKCNFLEAAKEKLDNGNIPPKIAENKSEDATHQYEKFKAILSQKDLVRVDSDRYPELYKLFELYVNFFKHEIEKSSLY
ncbi:hypothetical protein, partial [Aeromonas media]|uniref:hypothetical protein n=1 Tax=Aeromonas media TaxID=651 RepID=UPI003CFE54C7